jgi:hypothetical protein
MKAEIHAFLTWGTDKRGCQALRPGCFILGLDLQFPIIQEAGQVFFEKRSLTTPSRIKGRFLYHPARSVVTIPGYALPALVAVGRICLSINIQGMTLSASWQNDKNGQLCSGETRYVTAFSVNATQTVAASHNCNFEPSDGCLWGIIRTLYL